MILDEKIVYQNGCFKRVRRYLCGKQPEGILVQGLTGWETYVEKNVVVPLHKFQVIDLMPSVVEFTEIGHGTC